MAFPALGDAIFYNRFGSWKNFHVLVRTTDEKTSIPPFVSHSNSFTPPNIALENILYRFHFRNANDLGLSINSIDEVKNIKENPAIAIVNGFVKGKMLKIFHPSII